MEKGFYKINTECSKEEFIRNAWISLAEQDPPFEIFDKDFSEVNEVHHDFIYSDASFEGTWSARIGRYRQESYLDVETYYERIPYTVYKEKYDPNTRTYKQIPTTEYRKEERQRQVKKYRTVTDWSQERRSFSDYTTCIKPLSGRSSFDKEISRSDFNKKRFVPLSAEELQRRSDLVIDDNVFESACSTHASILHNNVICSLPGDKQEDVDFDIKNSDVDTLYLVDVPEYKASISFDKKSYEQKCFPFGDITMSEIKVPNPLSAEKEKERLEEKALMDTAANLVSADKKTWDITKFISFFSILLCLASIAVSIFIDVLSIVIACFAAAVVVFTVSRVVESLIMKDQTEKALIKNEEISYEREMNVLNFENTHKEALLEKLNQKLASLGLKPVENYEFEIRRIDDDDDL